MHALILLMIVAVTTFAYLVSKGWLPAYFNYVPELLSLAVAAYVVVVGVQSRFRNVRPIYWLVFGGLVVGLVCGAIVNDLQAGPMFAGLRTYFRALPFFLLPAVFLITEQKVRTQLMILLPVCLIQLPLAWQQRMATLESGRLGGFYRGTGDFTIGTLMNPGQLSLFLIAAACVLTGLYLRRIMSARLYLPLLLLIVLPTTLNETKITLVLLPLALLTAFFVGSEPGNRLKNMLLGTMVAAAFLAMFVPIYDHFVTPRWGYGIVDFFLMEGRVERYFMKGTEIGDQREAGRLDGMIVAVSELSRDPATLLFGLGIGNASDSALGAQFHGVYFRMFEYFPLNSFSFILLEFGLLGLLLVLSLHWIIFRECFAVARADRALMGALAIGWAGVSVTIAASLIYTNPIFSPALSYLYWYFSGVLVAFRIRADEMETEGSNTNVTQKMHEA